MKESAPPNRQPNLYKGKRVVKPLEKINQMDLQEEIIMDILSRLPVRSLLRFKCVSKFWMTLISQPYFTMKHLNHAKNNQNSQKILLLNKEFSFQCASLSSVQLFEDIQRLDRPSSGKLWGWKIHCCYDDLALIGVRNYPDKDFILLLWNPSTRESVVLPNPKFSQEVSCTWGLGYDSTTDDYKILKIDGKERNEILALKSGSWREIYNHPTGNNPVLSDMDYLAFRHGALDCLDTSSNMGYLAFVHGAFHWVDSLLNNSMVSFCILNEVYGEIPLPEGLVLVFDIMHSKQGVSVLGGMLCVYSTRIHHGKYTFKLWVMKEYGVKESWNQSFTIQSTNHYSITPKYRFSDGEVLLCCSQLKRSGSVFKTSKESSGLWPQSESECIQNGFVYTESLISPKLLS